MELPAAHAAVEAVARASYGRLVAYLAARSHDVAGAEDALADAFAAALRRWPEDGVPDKPEAWLLQAARNGMIDAARHAAVRRQAEPFLRTALEAATAATRPSDFPDERLHLLFVCTHPAIDARVRTPLMLQTVLGLDAARIASAFLVSPAAMEQRLVRAKTKIREAGIPFRAPEPSAWSERATFVLDAVYAAFTAGWERTVDAGAADHPLAAEAVALARMVVDLLPDEPEARGLLALVLHCSARRHARTAANGRFVPLDRQDPAQWSRPLIEEAEAHLRTASAMQRPGRYQLEAAIQSLHAHRAVSGAIDWTMIEQLYAGLVRLTPALGARVGHAVAVAEAGDVRGGLALLAALPAEQTASYQPWWAARAHLLRRLGETAEARTAYARAAGLAADAALRDYLLAQQAACS